MRYVKENFRTVAATLPVRTPVYDVSKVLGQMWTNLPAEQKQPFVNAQQSELAELEKVCATIAVINNPSWKLPAECGGGEVV